MSPYRMSRIESVIRIVLEFQEAFNLHDVPRMMNLMSDDCTVESSDPAPDGSIYDGKELVSQYWRGFFRESPQGQLEVEDIYGLGKRCILRWVYSWVEPAGEQAHVRGVDIYRVKDNLIQEQLRYVKG